MILRRDPDDLEAAIAGLSAEERAAFLTARAALPVYDVAPEDEARLQRGDIKPGEHFTLIVNGEPVEATFGGSISGD